MVSNRPVSPLVFEFAPSKIYSESTQDTFWLATLSIVLGIREVFCVGGYIRADATEDLACAHKKQDCLEKLSKTVFFCTALKFHWFSQVFSILVNSHTFLIVF